MGGRSIYFDEHAFGVEIFVEMLGAALAAVAAHLVAAEGHRRIDGVIGVDPDRAGAEGFGDSWCALATSRVNTPAARPIGRVVGAPTASSSVSKGSAEMTGPKISSRAIFMSSGDAGEDASAAMKLPGRQARLR